MLDALERVVATPTAQGQARRVDVSPIRWLRRGSSPMWGDQNAFLGEIGGRSFCTGTTQPNAH